MGGKNRISTWTYVALVDIDVALVGIVVHIAVVVVGKALVGILELDAPCNSYGSI